MNVLYDTHFYEFLDNKIFKITCMFLDDVQRLKKDLVNKHKFFKISRKYTRIISFHVWFD
jgi:hypothetical protein